MMTKDEFIFCIEKVMKEYNRYETLNDEDFLNSSHGETRRKKGQTQINKYMVRTLYPTTRANAMISVYAYDSEVQIYTSMKHFDVFEASDISTSKAYKTNGKIYVVDGEDYTVIYYKTELLIRRMFSFVENNVLPYL